ncbi:MAG: hypothetical protein KGM99_05290, partial [Burkholderiales bacterium]|nr:hypothetical protein [Burkholderiales bacterium]
MRIVQAVFGSLLIAAALPPTVALAAANLHQEERVDLRLITALRDEALNRSQAQKTLGVLTDEIGPRLTGSPAFRHAAEWTQSQLSSWGLQNVHAESFAPFGRSWTFDKASLRMVAPLPLDIVAIPKAWTSGTHGVQRGKLVFAKLSSDEELAKWKGKLAGRIVLLDEPAVIAPHLKGDASRYSEQELSDLTKMDLGEAQSRHGDIAAYLKKLAFRKKLLGFLSEEKVLAVLNRTRGEDGTIFVQDGGSYKKGDPESPPDLVVMTETYDRLYRLVEKKKDVELDVDVKADFGNEDPQ